MIRVVQLGSARAPNEGIRIGTVRRPPRGVPKTEFARQDWYDVWLPNLAPSDALVRRGQHATTAAAWRAFERGYRAEMKKPEAVHVLNTLAALSRHVNFAVGCYCEDENRCHRSILRQLLQERGASIE